MAFKKSDSFLSDECPPMGIYETLYAFKDSYGAFMGSEGDIFLSLINILLKSDD